MMGKHKDKHPEKRLFLIGVSLFICAFIVLGQVALKVRAAEKDDDFYKYADIFTEVFSEVKGKYVEEVDSGKLMEGALQGMCMTLDSHSQFLEPDSLSQLEKDTEGEFSGIGIHITIRDGVLTVIAPIPGSPSAKLGIRAWDRIIEIEGKSTEGITIMEAVKKLTGTPGTTVNITIYRKGEPKPLYFTVTRANIKVNSVYFKKIGDDIGYIRLAKYSESTAADMKKALLSLKKENIKGLIIDQRFNSGGLLDQVVKVAEYFVPKGEMIVSTKGRLSNQNREFKSQAEPIMELPLVVLVNRASASAAEILTGAIQDHKLGVIIAPRGEHTFGKGSVQTIEELKNTISWDENNNPKRCALRLTTARYYTPSGKTIDKVGITPDIEIDLPENHEAELASHGLMGDPDMTEPAISKTKKPQTIDEDEETSPVSELDKSDDDKFYMKAEKEKEAKEKLFLDVMLEESVKIMKAYLLMSGANSGSAKIQAE